MKIKCINDKDSISLIEGKEYNVKSINKIWNGDWYLRIIGISVTFRLPTDRFINLDGSIIKQEVYKTLEFQEENIYNTTLVPGMLLRCTNRSLKTLTYGKIYTYRDNTGYKITLEEIYKTLLDKHKEYTNYSIHNFKLVSEEEKRDIVLTDILEDGKDERVTNFDQAYIDDYDKITFIMDEIKKARDFIKKTKIENISIMEVLLRRNRDKTFLTEDNFKEISNINWEELLYKKH